MGLWNFLKLKPAKITNEEQLIYDISGAIIAISDITTDELYEHSKIIDKTHAFDITIEYLTIFLHALDRILFREVPESKRDSFYDKIEKSTLRGAKDHFSRKYPTRPELADDTAFITFVFGIFKKRMPKYESMFDLMSRSDSPKETVFWESGHILADTYFDGSHSIILYNSMILPENMIRLDTAVGGIAKRIREL